MRLATTCLLGAAAAVALTGCGTPATPSPSATRSGSPRPSASGTAANAALAVALTTATLPSTLSGWVQTTDGLLGTTPNTDSRVFASADNTSRVEIDIAADTGSTAATADYGAYQGAAAKQVATQAAASAPSIGQMANEYAGTTTEGHPIVALVFAEARYIVVVTMVTAGAAVDPAVVTAVARAQDARIMSGGS